MTERRVWITWETQRRSTELAELTGCKLYVLEADGPIRYLILVARTLGVLMNTMPKVLFVQNPSILLALVASIYRKFTNIVLIVDRHSNFTEYSPNRSWKGWFGRTLLVPVFDALSRFTLKNADITIVTNSVLADLVVAAGGSPFVLPDPIPPITPLTSRQTVTGLPVALVVSSFADDEPIGAIQQSARLLENEVILRFTGNPLRRKKDWRAGAPKNVQFTGFIPRTAYETELKNASLIVVLTTSENCLLCGCYEALAVRRPLITSSTESLREYFFAAVHVDPNPESIADGIRAVLRNEAQATAKVEEMAREIQYNWEKTFTELQGKLVARLQRLA